MFQLQKKNSIHRDILSRNNSIYFKVYVWYLSLRIFAESLTTKSEHCFLFFVFFYMFGQLGTHHSIITTQNVTKLTVYK
jgi:hypothetical protein